MYEKKITQKNRSVYHRGVRHTRPPDLTLRAVLAAVLLAAGLVTWRAALARSQPSVVLPISDAPAGPGAPVLSPDGVYVPPLTDARRRLPIVLALHGQSGSGPGIAQRLRGCA